ncbi:DEAD/DEAH box helicase [Paracoccus sp. S-4012]|nr:DEAD/DEAH box helicase [Paracoccus sp. S-4012]
MNDTPTQFSDLKLDPKVLQAVLEAGYTTPTPIQLGAIPPALEGRDVLGIAQTGTGKTAGFVLPMITLLGRGRARARMPRSLVLCPTRELAAQVAENFDTYAKHTRLTKALLIGGVSMKDQERLIDRGVDVLIATPGRLLDHFERGNLLLQGVQIMVVDEADRMLDMGFIPDIERIFQLTPFTRQTLFFSATMAPEIERITDTFLHAPARVEVARQATASETIGQRLIEITPTRKDQTAKQKRELLRAVIDAEGEALKNAIIFCNRKTDVDIVAKSLKAHGYDAAPIHGDLDQRVRTATLEGFREGTLRFLVASDVAARGLDIPAVSHVINFDLPSHAEDYVHRIGRTGRAGREGKAISLAVPADEKYLSGIENLIKQTLPRAAVPEGFKPGEAAERPAAARGEEGRASSRSRSRGGRGRARVEREEAPRKEAVRQAEAAPVPVRAEPVEAPRAAAPAPRREERRDERRDDRRDDHRRGDDRRGGRDERRGGGGGAAVLGMGDHVPEFLTRSFRAGEATAPEPEAAPAPAQQPDRAARSARTPRAAPEAPPAEKPPVEAVEPVAATEIAAETVAAPVETPEAPAPAVTPPPAEATPAVEETAAAKPAPRRRTRKKAEPEPEAASGEAAEAEATAKPVRRRTTRSKAQPAAETAEAEAAPAPEAEEATPKRRRSPRRKPAADTADGAAETVPDDGAAAPAEA